MAGDSIIVISQIEKTADRRIKESEKKMSDVIVLEDVTKRYGNEEVVKNASMHVKEGEIYGFLGPNGAGKTTVMKLILNLAKPTAAISGCSGSRCFRIPIRICVMWEILLKRPVFMKNSAREEISGCTVSTWGFMRKEELNRHWSR